MTGLPDFKWYELLALPFLLLWDFIKELFKPATYLRRKTSRIQRMIRKAPVMAKSEAQYAIESDAQILVDAEVIRKDIKRFEKAVAQIKKENTARQSAVKK